MIVGCDPGISGAIALLHDDGSFADVIDMPVIELKVNGKKRNRIVAASIARAVLNWQRTGPLHGIIEAVGPMPRDGSSQAFGMGKAAGILEGVLVALDVPISLVTPAVWKRAMGLSADKGLARMRASQTWPTHADKFKRVKDDGRAEAALIALYGLRSGVVLVREAA